MLLYFSSVIDMLSSKGESIMGNMKPLSPKTYVISPQIRNGTEESCLKQNKTDADLKKTHKKTDVALSCNYPFFSLIVHAPNIKTQ